MKRTQILSLLALVPALALAGCGGQPKQAEKANPAGGEKTAEMSQQADAKEGDTAMLTCPVSGHKVSRANAVMVEYDGKQIGLCCSDCVEPFKSNPAKYMAAYEKGEGVGEVPEGMK